MREESLADIISNRRSSREGNKKKQLKQKEIKHKKQRRWDTSKPTPKSKTTATIAPLSVDVVPSMTNATPSPVIIAKNKAVFETTDYSLLPSSLPTELLAKPDENLSWWDRVPELDASSRCNNDLLARRRIEAKEVMRYAVEKHESLKHRNATKDEKWMQTVAQKGTLVDKIGAMTLMVQSSPLHNLSKLEALVAMATKQGKREAEMAVEALKDLFNTTLLPDRKLREFGEIPWLTHERLTAAHLLIAEFEHGLKTLYTTFVQALEAASVRGLEHVKRAAMTAAYELLTSKPEMEQVLLSILVNKLGDPERKMAAKATFLLSMLVNDHPAMKIVIVSEVERILYRTNISPKAQYFAIVFLNQIMLQPGDTALAKELIKAYFSLFSKYTALKDSSMETRLLSALLTGVNRAFPFAQMASGELAAQIDSLFRVVHVGSFKTSVQALTLLFHVSEGSTDIRDRYFRTFYASLLSPLLQTASKHALFFNLVYRTLKADADDARSAAFVKRLLQVCYHMDAPFVCGCLYLTSQVLMSRPSLRDVIRSPRESLASTIGSVDARPVGYDPKARDPRAAAALSTCMWELAPLAAHSHPSVRKFAEALLSSDDCSIDYKGDPLNDFQLIAFLDRFSFRNPKKRDVANAAVLRSATRGSSKMQPYGFGKRGMKAVLQPVNSDAFLSLSSDEVPVDEKFFHEYFKRQESRGQRKKVTPAAEAAVGIDDSAVDEFADHLAEDMMLKHAKSTGGALDHEDVDLDWSDEDAVEDEEDEEDKSEMRLADSDEEYAEGAWGGLDEDDVAGDGEEEDDSEDDVIDTPFDEDDGSAPGVGQKRKSVFADADEFAEILESAGVDDRIPTAQRKWLDKGEYSSRGGGRGGRGGRGGKGRGGVVGGKRGTSSMGKPAAGGPASKRRRF